MKVLVACEFSGRVTPTLRSDADLKRGAEAPPQVGVGTDDRINTRLTDYPTAVAWIAWRDDWDEGTRYGTGASEAEAIENLLVVEA